jgi:hypothetical protein
MAAAPGDRFSSSETGPRNGPAGGAFQPEAAAPDDQEPTGPAAVRQLWSQVEELGEFARFYLAARMDAVRASLRKFAVALVLVAVGLVVIGSLLVTALVVLILGIGDGIGQALGDRLWAGYLITGGGLLLILGLTLFAAIRRLARSSRERTVLKYEQLRRQQKARFGHDVREQAGRQHPRN